MQAPSHLDTGIHIHPDSSRVIVRSFIPSDHQSVTRIIERALALSQDEVVDRLKHLHHQFDSRHPCLNCSWEDHYKLVQHFVSKEDSLTREQKLYIGALFSGEYALESAALFNPSIVPHPDQTGLPAGSLRFIMSLRATGEGHISSIAFRSGVIDDQGQVSLDPCSTKTSAPELDPDPKFRKTSFFRKLHDMEFDNAWSRTLMQSLGDYFTRSELDAACVATHASVHEARGTIECIQWLARANYQVNFDPDIPLSQRIIFPTSPNESNGIEDARFVHFRDDDGSENYYATYTAYNGHSILPQLLETPDFLSFQARTFDGACVRNKGMALFPRRIDGLYTMLSRQDDENLYLMFSDDVHFWDRAQIIRCPMEGWESVKIGNCGSPIETGAGWLVLTHGVGPMRRYCIGAILLDLDDPSRIIGHLPKPLIEPSEAQRDGYVPNVVYTCGALVHAGKLILPYGLSDTSTTISTIGLDELLARMLPEPALAGTG